MHQRTFTPSLSMISRCVMPSKSLLPAREQHSKPLYVEHHSARTGRPCSWIQGKLTRIPPQALAYLFHQSTYVFPIVGVQTPEHVRAMPDALRVSLSEAEIAKIHDAAPFNPLFPNNFFFPYKDGKGYKTGLRTSDVVQYKMAAWVDAPPRQQVRVSP